MLQKKHQKGDYTTYTFIHIQDSHIQTQSHPPAPAAGADVAAAPPSAAVTDASVPEAGVAKVSEVLHKPQQETEQSRRQGQQKRNGDREERK